MVIVVMGVSGAGKSTLGTALSDTLGWPFADGDDFHSAGNRDAMRSGRALTDGDREPWLRRLAEWIASQAPSHAVLACSALKRSYRHVLDPGSRSVWFVHLAPPREVLEDRLSRRRGHFMPADLLASQLADLEALGPGEPGITLTGDLPVTAQLSAVLESLPAAT